MRAKYESRVGESSLMWLYFEEAQQTLAESVSEKLTEYGYEVAHKEEGEFYMFCGDGDLTIAQMKEDYSTAKKEINKDAL